MVDIAKDYWGQTLGLFWNGVPAFEVPPSYITPDYSCNSIIHHLLINCNFNSKPKDKSYENDSDIDDHWEYTNDGYFLKDTDFLFEYEY